MDVFNAYKELGLASRLARLSDTLMKEVQLVYTAINIDFDPYLFPVFKIIVDQEVVTTSQICESLYTSQPAVTQSLKKLEKKKLISFKSDKKDGRVRLISLTSKGKRMLSDLKTLWGIIENEIKLLTHHTSKSLLEHLHTIETNLMQEKLSAVIIEKYHNRVSQKIKVISFESKYAKSFRDLNISWLEKYFVVEPHDRDLLNACEENIIDKEGYIFFAKINDEIAGTFSLMKLSDTVYELGKMAVDTKFQGLKIGQKLMEFCINFAKEKQWKSLLLYSNTKLENAIHIYKKYGFKEITLEEKNPYLRSNIKMKLKLN